MSATAMPIEIDRVETITFDSFTTIVDVWASTTQRLSKYVDDPSSIAKLWRNRAVDYRMVSNYTETYETYTETTRDALEYSLAAHGVDLPSDQIDELANVFYDLDVFDDVRASMEQLSELGYDMYIVSNGDPSILDAMVSEADIGDLLEDTISADEIETYKPDEAIYRHASDRTGTPIEEILHVATPWYDVYGANQSGMQTAWVNRKNRPWEKFDGEPDLTVGSLEELVATMNPQQRGG